MMLLDISGTLERRKQIQGFLLSLAIHEFGNSFTKGNEANQGTYQDFVFFVNFCSKKSFV